MENSRQIFGIWKLEMKNEVEQTKLSTTSNNY